MDKQPAGATRAQQRGGPVGGAGLRRQGERGAERALSASEGCRSRSRVGSRRACYTTLSHPAARPGHTAPAGCAGEGGGMRCRRQLRTALVGDDARRAWLLCSPGPRSRDRLGAWKGGGRRTLLTGNVCWVHAVTVGGERAAGARWYETSDCKKKRRGPRAKERLGGTLRASTMGRAARARAKVRLKGAERGIGSLPRPMMHPQSTEAGSGLWLSRRAAAKRWALGKMRLVRQGQPVIGSRPRMTMPARGGEPRSGVHGAFGGLHLQRTAV